MAGTIVADQLQDGAGNSTSMDNAIYGSAKAWVNFNGVSGSVAIRASYNVSSVTRSSTGVYVISFTNAFTDTNYCSVGMCGYNNTTGTMLSQEIGQYAPTTSSCTYSTLYQNGTLYDMQYVGVAVFR
jgi:hypothetical protein